MGITAGAATVFISLALLLSVNQGLHTPESVQCYGGKVYVSNIGNPPPDGKDGDGFISLLSEDGKVIKAKFVTGLNAPKGIAFGEGKLFVADIDRIVVIDPEKGEIVKSIPVPGSKFLNDTAFYNGRVYVSDTQTNTIYAVDPQRGKVKVFFRSPSLQGPNGLAFLPDGALIVVSWGGGKVFKLKGGRLVTLAEGFKNLDGVVVTEDGTVIFSDFSDGKVYALKGNKIKLLVSGLTSPADIGYCNGKLFIPEFLFNDVKVFRVKR